MKTHMFISTSGTMGVGKSTFTRFIADQFGFQSTEEQFKNNPFIAKFYKDMKRWAFHSELFFLSEKIIQLNRVKRMLKTASVVQDTPIEEDVYSYVKAHHLMGNLQEDEWKLYCRIYDHVRTVLPKPDVIVNLVSSVPVIYDRIKKRGRDFELVQKKDDLIRYLTLLDKLNRAWLRKYHGKVVEVDIETCDYRTNPTMKRKIKKQMQSIFTSL